MLKKLWSVKVMRFLTVGVFNTLFDLSILNTLVFVGHVPYVAANLVSASISMTVSYFLNHHIVFRSKDSHKFSRFTHFFAVTGIGILGIQSAVIYAATHFLDKHQHWITDMLNAFHISGISTQVVILNIAKILAVLAAMTWNFTIYRLVIFKQPDQPSDEDTLL